jgi:tetratricopeptide (TPR) repeat protein
VTVADSRIDELRRRLERDPGSRLFAQLAEELRKAGNHSDAIRIARTGLAQHPSYPSARLTLGRALLDSGDAAGARAELETALREAPDNILASRFLGQALEALGELRPALVQLQRTLKMAPGDRLLASQIASLETRLKSAGRRRSRRRERLCRRRRPGTRHRPPGRPGTLQCHVAPRGQASAPPTIHPPPGESAPGAWGAGRRRCPARPPPAAAGGAALPPPCPRGHNERLPPSTAAVTNGHRPTLPPAQSPAFGLVDETRFHAAARALAAEGRSST